MSQQLPPLPDVLKKRLVIGDWEQIHALNKYEKEIRDKKQAQIDDKNKKRYGVTFSVEGTYYVEVRAKDAKEAEEIAQDDFDITQIDIENTDISVDELGS